MQIKKIVATLSLLGLCSCALYGPSYNKPDVSAPTGWNSSDKYSVADENTNLAMTAWWNKFDDPVLNDLIKQALANNNNIQAAIGSIIQAQGALSQVQMGWVPTANLTAGYNTAQTFGGGGSANASTGQTGFGASSGYGVGLLPSYTINILQLLRQQDAAKANLYAAKYAKDAMRLTVISQVAGSYFTLLNQKYVLGLQNTLVADTQKQYELAQGQYKLGYISKLNLQQYEQQYYTVKAQVPITQSNIVNTQNAIKVLIDKNPGEIISKADFKKIKDDGIIPTNLPSSVLKNRPDVMQSEQQLVAANANIGVATSAFFPSISLTGAVATASSQLSNLFASANDFWQLQAQALMPVLNLSLYTQITQAKGAYYTAYYNYIQTVRNAFAQVDTSLASHDKTTDSLQIQAQVYDSAKTAYDLGDARYKQGADSEVTMLQYKIAYDNAAITLANLKLQQLQTIVNLYQVLAGGYGIDNTEEAKKFGDSHDS